MEPLLTSFESRHIGTRPEEQKQMLNLLGFKTLEELTQSILPADLFLVEKFNLPEKISESDCLKLLSELAKKNKICRNFIGKGFYDCITPSPILRNLLENPQWYTPYTPYQSEIAQGRLEALLNFQTMILELTGMDVANASLLDEASAAAEAMMLCARMMKKNEKRNIFFASSLCHPQTLEVLKTRAEPLNIELVMGDHHSISFNENMFGALVQYPDTQGAIYDFTDFCNTAHEQGVRVVMATDLLALSLLKTPADFGVDVVMGSSQRFGMPLGFGGPHAAFIATRENFRRQIPGRMVGVSVDREGNPALRLALQTREQHIRRDKATSNICTAQSLPAMVASMYGVYHGPQGLRRIAMHVHLLACRLAEALKKNNSLKITEPFFDTVGGFSLDETCSPEHLNPLLEKLGIESLPEQVESCLPKNLLRKAPFMQQEVFNTYHSETELMRYMDRLQRKDLGLTDSMIPLGSCTMKLNAATEMLPVTWPGFANIHPFSPEEETLGYRELTEKLKEWLAEITGFHSVSLQPNAGSQGEFAGLLAIRSYHRARGESQRNICLIPVSAHGTNPASAVMAGMKVISVLCDEHGNIDKHHMQNMAEQYRDQLAALMLTYPSTHGVFEEGVSEICQVVHKHGGQVFFDGANMNAMVGICRPSDLGADVCHLNLHKTFAIPHGGGGPGMGPIAVAEHLAPYIPGYISSTNFGSGSILPISYAYIALMGSTGLRHATQNALLNANYIAHRLSSHFSVLYTGRNGRVAHECIIDCRAFKSSAEVEVEDIAKRLIDYGFHAPTISWPVSGTMMIEPTESENKAELDRFCDALISIREEISAIETGVADKQNNVLKNAPHTAQMIVSTDWPFPYSRAAAVFPLPWLRERKYWPPVARVDNVYGDRNFVCSCS